MDLMLLPGVDVETAEKLKAAGVPSVARLSRAPDVVALAARAGVDEARVRALHEAARAKVEEAIRRAGIPDEAALANADAATVADATGIALDDVEWFQAAAREALAPTRVLLVEGSARARVERPSADALEVPIVTARRSEDAREVLARAGGDAVLLQEGAEVATARVGGAVHAEIPIYKARPDGEDVRVRVAEIRERRDEGARRKGSILDRFRKKKD